MHKIINPILPGFNPDPCLCRRGDDYYIATSTFEWFPGVQIHHSRDLVHWRLLTRPLTRTSQLNMAGVDDSGGIWAPCLTWTDDRFWLLYTDVKQHTSNYKDCHNYLVTAPEITGPWSEPIYLNSSGFDPSFFHDDDDRTWLVNMRWDHRPGRNRFNGIMLQEYDKAKQTLIGPIHRIFTGTKLGGTEGPHLYKIKDWYYLLVAEGGTGYSHAATVARSKNLLGPWEVQPGGPLITSADDPGQALQKAGHGSWIQCADGSWWLVHLCSRPVINEAFRRCILGRETALQPLVWKDGWPQLAQGGHHPAVEFPGPKLPPHPFPCTPPRDDFDASNLAIDFQTPRTPIDSSWCDLKSRPGWLRLAGRESPRSRYQQSLIARRIQHHRCRVSTCVDFSPTDFQQMAGLMALYDTAVWYYLRITHDEDRGRILGIVLCDDGQYREENSSEITLESKGPIELEAVLNGPRLQFSWRNQGDANWQPIGPSRDATRLSDEYGTGWNFTGAFFGLACQDLSGQKRHADFDWFEYEET